MKNLLVAIDLSPSHATVIERAAALARVLGCRLWVLHVVDADPDFVGYGAGPQVVRDSVARELRGEHGEIQALADRLRADGLDASGLTVQGPIVEKILAEADRLGADMIVMGSHGRGALYHAVLGSVSTGVLRETTRPVVVVPVRSA